MNHKRSNSSHEKSFNRNHNNSGGKRFKSDEGYNKGPGLLGAAPQPGCGLLGPAPVGFVPDSERGANSLNLPGPSNLNQENSRWSGSRPNTENQNACSETASLPGGPYSGAGSSGWKKLGKRSNASHWSTERDNEVWKHEMRTQPSKITEEESRKTSMERKHNVWNSESRNQRRHPNPDDKGNLDNVSKSNFWSSENTSKVIQPREGGSWKSSVESKSSWHSEQSKTQEDSLLKCQIKELKDYILKLEDDKKALNEKVDKLNITNNKERDTNYIGQLEADKKALNEKIEELKAANKKDGNIINLIKANIEKVKQVQQEERQKLDKEKLDLTAEKNQLKYELDNARENLERERKQFEEEKRSNENKNLDETQWTLFEKRRLQNQLSNMRKEIDDLRKMKDQAEERYKNEEKKHLANELEELEIRRGMTQKAIECESVIEQLGDKIENMKQEVTDLNKKVEKKDSENKTISAEMSRLSKQLEESLLKEEDMKNRLNSQHTVHTLEKESLQKKFDSEYAIFLKKADDFDDNMRINCVFCPQENFQMIQNYIFHIAREHMFDQYKANDIKNESVQVGMLLKILEDKAKKNSLNEIEFLKNSVQALEQRCMKAESAEGETNRSTDNLKAKVVNLERDIQFLLETEAGQKEYIEDLKTRNNTLQNQVKSYTLSETTRLENKELKKQLVSVTNERDSCRNKLSKCEAEKLEWKTKWEDSTQERDNLMEILDEQERQKDKAEEQFKEDLRLLNEKSEVAKTKIKFLEEENKNLFSVKSCLETENSNLKAKCSNSSIKQKLKDNKENEDKPLLTVASENRERTKKTNWCDCARVNCDDCDILFGYLNKEPYGIREMSSLMGAWSSRILIQSDGDG